jgi:polyhydroxyalkanoate synthesis regulator phasin
MSSDNVKKIWDIHGKHSVQRIATGSISGSGVDDILVGRENGLVQVYSFDSSPVPRLIFERCIDESITGLESGYTTSATSQDIVVSTYSGKVLAYSSEIASRSEQQLQQETNDSGGSLASRISKKISNPLNQTKIVGVSHQEKMNNTRKEIEKLEAKLNESKFKYNKLSVDMVAVHCKVCFFVINCQVINYQSVFSQK